MFRLIKLAAYVLLGYAVYEFYLGLSGTKQPALARSRQANPRRSQLGDPSNQNISGPGEGMTVQTQGSRRERRLPPGGSRRSRKVNNRLCI